MKTTDQQSHVCTSQVKKFYNEFLNCCISEVKVCFQTEKYDAGISY